MCDFWMYSVNLGVLIRKDVYVDIFNSKIFSFLKFLITGAENPIRSFVTRFLVCNTIYDVK